MWQSEDDPVINEAFVGLEGFISTFRKIKIKNGFKLNCWSFFSSPEQKSAFGPLVHHLSSTNFRPIILILT